MKTLSKVLVGTVAAGAMAVSSATPAMARDRDGGISTGEVIAGAVILGGIAAVIASSGKDRNENTYGYGYDPRNDGRYYNNGYNGMSQRDAVNVCTRTAERAAQRVGRANVTQIYKVDRKRDGYEVRGNIAVNGSGNYGYRDQRYGYNNSRYDNRGYDTGKFYCTVRNGRVVDLDFKSIRGL